MNEATTPSGTVCWICLNERAFENHLCPVDATVDSVLFVLAGGAWTTTLPFPTAKIGHDENVDQGCCAQRGQFGVSKD